MARQKARVGQSKKRGNASPITQVGGQWVLDSSIVNTDLGNGKAYAAFASEGQWYSSSVPHARARVTGDTLETNKINQKVVSYADFLGRRYGIGDGIWELSQYPIETDVNSADRYGSSMHVFWALVNMASLNIPDSPDNPITLVTACPPGLFNKVQKEIKRGFMVGEDEKRDGTWTIKLSTQRDAKQYTFDRVVVVPEGAAAYAAYAFDIQGDQVDTIINDQDVLGGNIAVLDLGFGTGDTFIMSNGYIAPDGIAHATDDQAGILLHILQPAMDSIASLTGATHIKPAMVDFWLRTWADHRKRETYTVKIAGKQIKMDVIFAPLVADYADWIMREKIQPIWRSGADAILAVGGGWHFIHKIIKRRYSDRMIITPDMFPHTAPIKFHELNGYGGLPLVASLLK